MSGSCEGCKWAAYAAWLMGPVDMPVPPFCETAPCLVCPRLMIFRDRYEPGERPKVELIPVTHGGRERG